MDAKRIVLAALPVVLGVIIVAAGESQEPPKATKVRERLRKAGRQVKGVRAARRAGLRAYGDIIESSLGWPGLATFLDMFAHGESRWTPLANQSKLGTNAALGAYQIRPTSAFPSREFRWKIPPTPAKLNAEDARKFRRKHRRRRMVQHSRALMDARVNTAAIVSFMGRMHNGKTRNATWRDLDVAGAYPIFIHGRPTFLPNNKKIRARYPTLGAWQQRYDEAMSRTERSAKAVGAGADFLDTHAFPSGFAKVWRNGPFSDSKTAKKSVRTLIVIMGGFDSLAGLVDDA